MLTKSRTRIKREPMGNEGVRGESGPEQNRPPARCRPAEVRRTRRCPRPQAREMAARTRSWSRSSRTRMTWRNIVRPLRSRWKRRRPKVFRPSWTMPSCNEPGEAVDVLDRRRHRLLRQRPPLPRPEHAAAQGRGADRGDDQLLPLRLRPAGGRRAASVRGPRRSRRLPLGRQSTGWRGSDLKGRDRPVDAGRPATSCS